MSYSFSIKGASRREVHFKLRAALARIILSQPAHAADVPIVQAAAEAAIASHREPKDNEHMQLDAYGSCWSDTGSSLRDYDQQPAGTQPPGDLAQVQFGVTVKFVQAPVPDASAS